MITKPSIVQLDLDDVTDDTLASSSQQKLNIVKPHTGSTGTGLQPIRESSLTACAKHRQWQSEGFGLFGRTFIVCRRRRLWYDSDSGLYLEYL
jgi:hypothetical protein